MRAKFFIAFVNITQFIKSFLTFFIHIIVSNTSQITMKSFNFSSEGAQKLHRPSFLSECGMFSVKAQDGKPVVRFSVYEDESGGIVNRDGF